MDSLNLWGLPELLASAFVYIDLTLRYEVLVTSLCRYQSSAL